MSFLSPITDFIKKYGVIGIILHIAISLFFLLAIFALLTYGIDLKATLRAVGINLDKYEWSRSMGQYAIIMGVYRVLSPIRYGLLFILVPLAKKLTEGNKVEELKKDKENDKKDNINEKEQKKEKEEKEEKKEEIPESK